MHPDKRRRGRLIRKIRRAHRAIAVAFEKTGRALEEFSCVAYDATEEVIAFAAALRGISSPEQLSQGAPASLATGPGDPTYSGVTRGTEAQGASRG